MSRTYHAPKAARKREEARLPTLCQLGKHAWEALMAPGWFECVRCGRC